MASKRCPTCGLVNPATADRCDCGWSFARQELGEPPRIAKPGAAGTEFLSKVGMRLAVRVTLVSIAFAIAFAISRCSH